jgi:hypothetical protein
MRLRVMIATAILTGVCGTQAFAGPTVVSCSPGQHAVVRSTFTNGEEVTRVQCVSGSSAGSYRTRYVTRYADERPRRSWGKTALTIAGGAGTGAGVGAIVKGKKGALIGAALGGGAASLYESAKRR